MSPAHVVEPTYERLKRDLLEGKWRQGARLEAMRLADDFGVSMTPVRDCLNRLAGEGLVDMRPGHGYHVPSLTEKELRDLLQSSAALLDFAVTCERPDIRPAPPKINRRSYGDRVAGVFRTIAQNSGNLVLAELMDSVSDRLYRVRAREARIIPDTVEEIRLIENLAEPGGDRLRRCLEEYHRRRCDKVASLVQLLT